MPKHSKNRALSFFSEKFPRIKNFLEKVYFIVAIWLYILLFFGFVFHTSDNKEFLGKYSYHYSLIFIGLFLLFIPYILFLRYTLKESLYRYKKRKVRITSWIKILSLFLLILGALIVSETYFRLRNYNVQKNVYGIENVHPFLQVKMTKGLGEKYHINSLGFRNDEFKKIKDSDTYRIVLMGGSTVINIDVPYEKNVGKILEDELTNYYHKKFEIINAGVQGYTSEHSIIDYMFRISELKPDLVIMWHGVNDLYASCPTKLGTYKSDYSHLIGQLENAVFSYFKKPIIQFNVHSVAADYILNLVSRYLYTDITPILEKRPQQIRFANSKESDFDFPSINSYRRNLEYFVTVVKADNVKVILGNQPNIYSKLKEYKMDYASLVCYENGKRSSLQSVSKAMEQFNTVAKEVSVKNDVPFINLDSLLPKNRQYYSDVVHWTAEGNAVIGNELFKFIRDNNFIPN